MGVTEEEAGSFYDVRPWLLTRTAYREIIYNSTLSDGSVGSVGGGKRVFISTAPGVPSVSFYGANAVRLS